MVKYMKLQELIDNAPGYIKKNFIHRKYKKGSFIIHPYEENKYLYIIIDGSAEVYNQTYAGTILSLYQYNSYSCFGEIEIFNKEIKTLGVIAKTNCEVIVIHKNIVYEWMKSDFNFTLYILEQLSTKLILSSDSLSKISLLTIKDRILCSIHTHYKIGDLDKLSKHKLANEVCAPIRSLNRSIAKCIQENYINYKDKKFTVISTKKLEKHVESLLF